MTKIDEGIYKWDKRTTHKFVGGLWACDHPLSPKEGGFDGLHMFGGTEPPRGTGEIQWFTEGVTYGSITGPKWFGPKDGGEEKNITGSRTGLSDQQMVLWHFQMGEVELNMDFSQLANCAVFSDCVCVC